MPTTLTDRTRSEARSLPRWAYWVAGVVGLGLVAFAVSTLVRGPRFVSQVSFVNPSPFALDVQVAGASRDDWMLLGTMAPKTTSPVEQVVDQGATWVFSVDAQGDVGGDFSISRANLAASGWRVTIPAEVVARLQAQGAVAQPTQSR